MIPGILTAISIGMSAVGTWNYVRDTFAGTTKPNRITWSMWALAPITASVIAYWSGGDGWSALKVFSAGFFPLIIFLASFYNTQSYWRLGVFDIVCGALSLLALIIWVEIHQSAIAVALAIAGDFFASLPTITKAWRFPETETGISYAFYAASFIPSLLAFSVWNFENASFQVYLLCLNIFLVYLAYRKRGR